MKRFLESKKEGVFSIERLLPLNMPWLLGCVAQIGRPQATTPLKLRDKDQPTQPETGGSGAECQTKINPQWANGYVCTFLGSDHVPCSKVQTGGSRHFDRLTKSTDRRL